MQTKTLREEHAQHDFKMARKPKWLEWSNQKSKRWGQRNDRKPDPAGTLALTLSENKSN